jgi:uncharacterized damage-inducible protein DinB
MRLSAWVVAAMMSATVIGCSTTSDKTAATSDSAASPAPNVTADILNDLAQAEQKVVGLAKEIPEAKYAWRPGAGVRSVGQVVRHIAADNYLLPAAAFGATPDSATGIKGDDYTTAAAFEERSSTKDASIADLERSFAFLKQSIQGSSAPMTDNVTLFGQTFTRQQALILTATHLHEHLGQLIAYARTNGVKPPWSN